MTKIQWTDQTWNPIVGCDIVSPGCANCYAMKTAWRLGHNPKTPQYHGLTKKVNGKAVWTGDVRLVESALLQPLKRKKPTKYFVNSMGDLFHENVPEECIDDVFSVMARCPWHTFQILTKRPERMRDYMSQCRDFAEDQGSMWPLPNVWLGVSVENQATADERIPQLLATPAALRFISAEPLLGPISLRVPFSGAQVQALKGAMPALGKLDWVICGGESGPSARPMHPDWACSLRNQCAKAGAPFWFKQWGEWGPCELLSDNIRKVKAVDYSGRVLTGATAAFGGLEPVELMSRFGNVTGNLLDGETHEKMPELQP